MRASTNIDFAVFAGDEETDGERHAQHQHYADDARRRADGGFEFVLRSHSAHKVVKHSNADGQADNHSYHGEPGVLTYEQSGDFEVAEADYF